MAKISGKITGVKLNALENLGRKLGNRTRQYDILMQRRMELATSMIWRLAHQKRPYISKQHQKRGFRTKSGSVHHNRVSDPNAQLGVPVDTGLLQSAIKKEVTRVGYGKFQGVVYVDLGIAPYGIKMEYGDSKVHARPFMRPAAALTREAVLKMFRAKAEIK
jgi:hypothetical protein